MATCSNALEGLPPWPSSLGRPINALEHLAMEVDALTGLPPWPSALMHCRAYLHSQVL